MRYTNRHFTYLLTYLKLVSESRVTWATSVPILVFLGLSVLELGLMYATDVRQKHRSMRPPYEGWGITKAQSTSMCVCWCVTGCATALLHAVVWLLFTLCSSLPSACVPVSGCRQHRVCQVLYNNNNNNHDDIYL